MVAELMDPDRDPGAPRPELVLRTVVRATPDACLSPNARCHRLRKADRARELRAAAKLAAVSEINGGGPAGALPAAGPLWLDLCVLWPKGKRPLDFDNAVASAKPLCDGIFDALGADDRRVAGVALRQGTDPEGRGLVAVAVYAGEAPWVAGTRTATTEDAA